MLVDGWWGLVHAVCILHFGGRSQNTAMNSLDQAEFSGEYWSSANTAREETTLRQASVKLGGRGGGLRHESPPFTRRPHNTVSQTSKQVFFLSGYIIAINTASCSY
jgi:hypothetical protein